MNVIPFLVSLYETCGIWLSDYGSYLLIPVFSALAGWGTNWLAIKMTFYPVKYVGRYPFGWQGVVPARTHKFAGGLVDRTIDRIGGLSAIVNSMDLEQIKTYVIDSANPLIAEAVNELMREEKRVLWENMPATRKKMLHNMIKKEMLKGVDSLTDDFHYQFERLLDLKELVLDKCEEQPDLLNKLVFAVAAQELQFLVNSGAVFGFVFGLIQAAVWYYYPQWWVLPFFGLLVGTLTNWIALQLIFTPLEPKKFGPFVFQGLFLKRQDEISREFARVISEDLINAREIVNTLLYGSRSDRTMALLRSCLSQVMEQKFILQLLTQTAFGLDGYANLEDAALKTTIHYAEELSANEKFNLTRASAIQRMLYDRLAEQSPVEFQELIRPIFHEDEWIIVSIGGVLGGLVGWAQLVWLFGDT